MIKVLKLYFEHIILLNWKICEMEFADSFSSVSLL